MKEIRWPRPLTQGHDHIVYLNDQAHLGGTNYVMADDHAKWMKLQTTMYVTTGCGETGPIPAEGRYL